MIRTSQQLKVRVVVCVVRQRRMTFTCSRLWFRFVTAVLHRGTLPYFTRKLQMRRPIYSLQPRLFSL